jgi:hypothetical protein
MQKRLFFLRQDGWFEMEISAKLLNSPNEELFKWTYAMMDKHGYRNYLITENPGEDTGCRSLDTGYVKGNILLKTLLLK